MILGSNAPSVGQQGMGQQGVSPIVPSPEVPVNPAIAPSPPVSSDCLPKGVAPLSSGVEVQELESLAQFVSTQFVSQVAQTADWVNQPAIGMGSLFEELAPQMMAYLSASPMPEIHARARQARVPVAMYHDILTPKQVFFDVTPEEFEQHLQLIQENGVTPISLDQLVAHLRTGMPLPEKPILLTFDDGYLGHFTQVYPLLKKYNYPAVFSIYPSKLEKPIGRPGVSWEQLKEMAADPLVTIASHSVTHKVMFGLSDEQLRFETQESKKMLETKLGMPIRYFTYPEGKYDEKAMAAVQSAGYMAALTMDDANEQLAGQSVNLFAIGRYGQSRIRDMVTVAWGGPELPPWNVGFNFNAPIQRIDATVDNTKFIFLAGGKPITIHDKTRGQVPEILARTNTGAIAAVDGGFFSLESLDSNVMIGPVYSQIHKKFIPGNANENKIIRNRPLVVIGPKEVKFIPFDPNKHNTLDGIKAEMPDATDAFVGAGFLVENGQPQPDERFGKLFDFNAARHRAFWGINQAGQPQIGVSVDPIGSVDLGAALAKAGFRDAVMLDSGASTSLAYKGDSLVAYEPRPVPHLVALIPTVPELNEPPKTCAIVSPQTPETNTQQE